MPINNIKITRRNAIKSLSMFTAAALIPTQNFAQTPIKKRVVYIKFGGGIDLLNLFKQKEIDSTFIYVNETKRNDFANDIQVVNITPPIKLYTEDPPSYNKNYKTEIVSYIQDRDSYLPTALLNSIQEADRVVLLTDALSTYTGSALFTQMAKYLYAAKKPFVALLSVDELPDTIAPVAIKAVNEELNCLHCFKLINDKKEILKKIGKNVLISEYLRVRHLHVYQQYANMSGILY